MSTVPATTSTLFGRSARSASPELNDQIPMMVNACWQG
jgi:hypothetical protein